ncbi:hypothetical protein BH711_14215 [Pseudomonas fluorescens]|nr:hypothetical protein PD374_19715 [Pseudomonas sp. WCS374]AOS75041.1 hypothetical protein BH711_14215 [Pseudomonas fluorescens]
MKRGPVAQVIGAIGHQAKQGAQTRSALPTGAGQDHQHHATEDIQEIEQYRRQQAWLIKHQRAEQGFIGGAHEHAKPEAVEDQEGEQGAEVGKNRSFRHDTTL